MAAPIEPESGRLRRPQAAARSGRSAALRALPSTREDDGLFLCFSHLRWDFVRQRPQHLLTRAARRWSVVMVEEPLWEACAAPRLDVTERPGGVRIAVPVLPEGLGGDEAEAAQRGLVDALVAAERPRRLIAWYYTPMALPISAHLAPDLVVYDNMDELSAFRGASPAMLANEEALLARADLVFTGGVGLFEAKRARHPAVTPHPSSIDREHFAAARAALPDPADQADLPHPRLGFFGVIDERMDVDLLAAVADLRPDWSFAMIGPVVKIAPESLPGKPNIRWLGMKSYDDLPAYLAGWDVGLMPFALNESTRFISPTKTPEYLAAGLPVISTPILDVVRPYGEKGLVAIAATPAEVVAAAEAVMSRPREAWLEAVDRHLATTSWDLTWSRMEVAMDDMLDRGRPPAAAPGRPSVRL